MDFVYWTVSAPLKCICTMLVGVWISILVSALVTDFLHYLPLLYLIVSELL